MNDLNTIIHQPVRLRIMAALTALPADAQLDFVSLRTMLDLSDGNLSTHLRKLEHAGYVREEKLFAGRKPRTYLAATPKGIQAFAMHIQALQDILHHTQDRNTPA